MKKKKNCYAVYLTYSRLRKPSLALRSCMYLCVYHRTILTEQTEINQYPSARKNHPAESPCVTPSLNTPGSKGRDLRDLSRNTQPPPQPHAQNSAREYEIDKAGVRAATL